MMQIAEKEVGVGVGGDDRPRERESKREREKKGGCLIYEEKILNTIHTFLEC